MDGLVIGIDLCNEYTQIHCGGEEQTWTIPTVICKNKTEEAWYVGEEAYAHTLVGDGIIVDKLVKLVEKEGTATLGEVRYEAKDLMLQFLYKTLELPEQEHGTIGVRQLVFAVPKLDGRLIECLYHCAQSMQIPRKRVHIISHTESFIYYVLSQKKEIWNNVVGLFDLTDTRLRYYELKVQRGLKKTTVMAEYEELEEGFNLDILSTPSGAKLGDKILCSCAERLMQRKLYSAVFLTGKGFLERDWAKEFMRLLCAKRRVYVEPSVFSQGASYKAADFLNEKTSYPFTFICDGRLKSTVSLNVRHKGQDSSVALASAGENWYDLNVTADVILDGQKDIDFFITPLDLKKKKQVKIPLEGFPDRPNRTTRVQIQLKFLDDKTMEVRLKDRGFGELFPAADHDVRQEVML